MNRSLIFVIIIISILSTRAIGQTFLTKSYLETNLQQERTFYDVQQAFYNWVDTRNLDSIRGTKRFKRWEWFYEPRVYPTGEMPNPNINYIEWRKANLRNGDINWNNTTEKTSNWVSISPNEVPPTTDEINITGMGRINCVEFHPTNPFIIWIGASQGGLWKTTDGGSSWVCLTDNLPLNRISDIEVDPSNPDIIYLATGDIEYFGLNVLAGGFQSIYGLGIYKTTDGGINWSPLGLDFSFTELDNTLLRRIFVNPDNSNELITAGIAGILKSYNGGIDWVTIYNDMVIDLDKNPFRDSTLYATGLFIPNVGGANRILKSVDFGNTWDTLNTMIIPTQNHILRSELEISPSDTSVLYVLSCGLNEGFYALFKSIDAGNNWFAVAARDTSDFNGASQIANVLGWADGGYFNNPLLPPDEGGQGTYDLTLVIDPNNADIIYTGGVNMWGSNDGGTTWSFASMWLNIFGESIHADQHCSKYNPLTGELFQTNDGGIYKTNNIQLGNIDTIVNCVNIFTMEIIPNCYTMPTIWTNLSNGIHITEYYRIATCKNYPNIIIGGTQDNGSFMLRNGIWQNIYGGDGMNAMIDHYDPDILYVTNQRGTLNKSTDGGLSFTAGIEEPITNTGEIGNWVTPYIMHPQESNIIFTAFQNIWRSNNGGDSWTKISSIGTAGSSGTRTFNVLTVAPSNPDYIFAARPGALFRTKDGGNTWDNLSNNLPLNDMVIMSLVVADNNSDLLWVAFNGYEDGQKVYQSIDAGDTWENISGYLPNVSANSLAFQFGTINGVNHALYVGTDIGIYYTNDSIQQTPNKWADYSQGLPNVIVTDLEIQYGSQKLYSATYGRGLWESDLYSPSIVDGIEPIDKPEFMLSVYPNPTNTNVTVNISNSESGILIIQIFSLLGTKLLEYNSEISNSFNNNFDISHFQAGTYLLRVSIGNSDYSYRIIKMD